jgi:hypothetical protein
MVSRTSQPTILRELRLIPTGVHTLADVHETIAAFQAVAQKLAEGYRMPEFV